jgi:hypothetical protein
MKKKTPQYKIEFCMKRGLFLLIIVVFSHCQNKYRFPKDMPPIPENREIVPECGWFGTMSVEEQRKTFPFNEAKKILLIAYGDYEIKAEREEKTLETEAKSPILKTFAAFEKVYSAYEIVELNQQQIDSLSHFALNYKSKVEGIYTKAHFACYTPRNSILFFDKNEKLILNIEMCFECQRIYFTPAKMPSNAFNAPCQDLDYFKAFFKQCNVHYGIDSLKSVKY